jgi:hypothetical protein
LTKEERKLPSFEIKRKEIAWIQFIISILAVFFTYFLAFLMIIVRVSVQDATTNTPASITGMWIELIGITFLWSFTAIAVCSYFIRIIVVLKTEEMEGNL